MKHGRMKWGSGRGYRPCRILGSKTKFGRKPKKSPRTWRKIALQPGFHPRKPVGEALSIYYAQKQQIKSNTHVNEIAIGVYSSAGPFWDTIKWERQHSNRRSILLFFLLHPFFAQLLEMIFKISIH